MSRVGIYASDLQQADCAFPNPASITPNKSMCTGSLAIVRYLELVVPAVLPTASFEAPGNQRRKDVLFGAKASSKQYKMLCFRPATSSGARTGPCWGAGAASRRPGAAARRTSVSRQAARGENLHHGGLEMSNYTKRVSR